jgi:hypothetical protein
LKIERQEMERGFSIESNVLNSHPLISHVYPGENKEYPEEMLT